MEMKFLDRYRDLGLLILRIGIGGMFVFHGTPKIIGGPAMWEKLGGAVHALNITFLPTIFWGFMAAFSECFGGIFLALGIFFRPACILMAITMVVATSQHLLVNGDSFGVASHAIESGILFISLVLIGPGKYTVR